MKTREIHLKDDLQLLKRRTRSVTEYSRSFKALCDQLVAMGRPVDDTDKVHWYLRGLGPEFVNFSTTDLSISPLPLFVILFPKLKAHKYFRNLLKHLLLHRLLSLLLKAPLVRLVMVGITNHVAKVASPMLVVARVVGIILLTARFAAMRDTL